MSNGKHIGEEELSDILSVIHSNYGYDFSGYSRASFKRRVLRCLEMSKLKDIYELKYHLVNDAGFFQWFLEAVTVNVTEMFRDPEFYADLKKKVFTHLASYPVVKIWHAGCATGEEVYSMAIWLQEAGLLNRCRIYATDINPANIEKAKKGIVSLQYMKNYTQNYLNAGGNSEFSDYYTARYGNALLRKDLKDNIVFSLHNLVTDQVFNEFQLICCRNVLIYFKRDLQNQVIHLFYDSLSPLGYLAIGTKESLHFTDLRNNFETVSTSNKIYRRKG